MDLNEIGLLEDRLREIDALLKDNEERSRAVPAGSFVAQEVESERTEMHGHRRVVVARLDEINAGLKRTFGMIPPRRTELTDEELRRKATLDNLVEEKAETIRHQVALYEKAGDLRQARVWRGELVGLRESTARSYGLLP